MRLARLRSRWPHSSVNRMAARQAKSPCPPHIDLSTESASLLTMREGRFGRPIFVEIDPYTGAFIGEFRA